MSHKNLYWNTDFVSAAFDATDNYNPITKINSSCRIPKRKQQNRAAI